ncbi:lysylphosphatidylglycerol synthase transmembrane domain-containing protein [Gymnodinialimonas sp.]
MTRPAVPNWLIRALQVAALLVIAALLWRAVDWREALALLQSADPRWLVAAALALTAQTVLSALRWRMTAARLGIDILVPEALREYYLSQVVNQSLPGGVVGDAGRAVRARGQAGLLASGQAVVFERVAGQLGLLALLALGLIFALLMPTGMTWPMWLIVPVLTGTLALIFIAAVLWMRTPADTALGRGIRSFRHAVLAREVLPQQTALSLGTALCNIAAFGFCAVALGVALPLLAALALVPLILFAMVLPLSVSGWGLREGAATMLFPLIGASMSEGLAVSVAFGLVFLATVVPGLVLTWLRPNAPVFGRR